MYKKHYKRPIDFTVALLAFIFLSPVFLFVTIFLWFANGGFPFFFQLRPGLDENIFKIIKFKTMNEKKDNKGELLPDSDRLTAIGSFVRRISLDEIPQLLNVIKGDMALIGPRPLLVEYLPLYNERQKQRHAVRPGITGWAQVNGRNAISWENKFDYDVYYVNNISFLLDLKIIFTTVLKVIKSDNISSDTSVTMQKFTGS
jgi:undecaprenyl phosphate N,N'-diacetylbacillosamine 1-phosphate transferase